MGLTEYVGLERISLTEVIFDPQIVQKVSEELARRYTLIPLSLNSGRLQVAMADPTDVRAIDAVRLSTGYEIKPLQASPEEIDSAIRQHFTVEKSLAQLKKIPDQVQEEPSVWSIDSAEEILTQDSAPTVRLVDSLLHQAVKQGASDIHWEPSEQEFIVRFRIDGKLELRCRLPLIPARSVVSRLKVMAMLDVAERRLPQDGRIAIEVEGRKIDLRVSSLPTVFGEKIVVRILDPETAARPLEALGMSRIVENGMRNLLRLSHGLILVVGPTGSGKTTTLYALLRELDAQAMNIISIEDPVEYRLPGVNQVQVHPSIGMDFARGLRAILRQDPDVIMIGEIRDEETAGIAISAALTGHLVLSTLHTNTAAEALPRLLEMGIEPYLLAAGIRGVLSQRLVRLLCPQCKQIVTLNAEEKKALPWAKGVETLYKAEGCGHCRGTGYFGRIGIHELLLYNQSVKELVLSRNGASAIEQEAIKAGMVPLIEDGVQKAVQGLTSIEEVLRSTVAID